jgi:CubicO group peptidase (beta-lactamase class C family)
MKALTNWLSLFIVAALIGVFSGCFLPGTSAAEVLPDTPAGRRMEEILDLIDQADSETIKEYVSEEYTPGFRDALPIAQHVGVFRHIRAAFPGLVPVSLIESSGDVLKVLLQSEPSGLWLEIQLQVEKVPPYRIATMVVKPAKGPPQQGEAIAWQPEVTSLAELDPYLSDAEEDNTFSGVVLIAEDETPIFYEAYGLADKNHGVSNSLDTKFNLGSINKIFTSIAAAQLMEQGRLGLDDPIGKYLHEFPKESATKVTIRDLLQMSSGWGDYWDNETYLATRFDLRTVADYMRFLKDVPLEFEPGSESIHSNTGYEVLGAVIEKITGQDYYDYIRENIYTPAGMTSSDSYERDAVVENMATGYTNMHPYDEIGGGYLRTNTLMLSPRGTPAGGGYSIAEDMLKFATALKTYELLGSEYTGLLLNSFEDGEEGSEPRRSIAIAGGAPGVSAFLSMGLESKYTVIVLSNYDTPAAIEVGRMIRGVLAKQQ